MSACQRCWDDAWLRSRYTPESQAEAYKRLIAARDATPTELRKCREYNYRVERGET
jgi:hypothetical protein